MDFRTFDRADLPSAARLLAARHRRERAVFPTLKAEFEDSARTASVLEELLDERGAMGLCACEGGEMRGYILSSLMTDGPFGRCAFVRCGGMAVAETEAPELYRRLYAEIAKRWLEKGALYHYAVVPTGDPGTVDAWLRLSFAYQQAYGVSALSESEVPLPEGPTIRPSTAGDAEAMRGVSHFIYAYQAKSPTYAVALPERLEEIREGYGELAGEESALLLLACRDGRLLGFQCADLEEEPENMMMPEKGAEITICAVAEDSRREGLGGLLTRATKNALVARGYENALADWRVANLCSSNFWPRQGFRPIAYRMFRAIDERVYWGGGTAR